MVGSLITGTHGGSIYRPEIATIVTEIEVVEHTGKVRRISAAEPHFRSVIHSFGMLGAITSATLRVLPEFGIRKCIYEGLSWDHINDPVTYNKILADHDYISFFANFQNPEMTSVWTSQITSTDLAKVDVPYQNACAPEFYGAKLVHQIHPVPGRSSAPCVTSGYGMWYDRIYHFRPDAPPSSAGEEIHTEYFVKLQDLPRVLEALNNVSFVFKNLLQISELRPLAASNLPLGPSDNEAVMGVHWTWKLEYNDVVNAS